MTPTFSQFLDWVKAQKDTAYDFISPTNCVVARFITKHNEANPEDPVRFEGGHWSSLFPGDTYEKRLRNYHMVCDAKPYTYKGVLDRAKEVR